MYLLEPIQTEFFDQAHEGIVEMTISSQQSGRAKVLGVSWMAQLYPSEQHTILPPGQPIKAVGRRGNTLLVHPAVH